MTDDSAPAGAIGILATRIGRRFLAMFLLCALVPLLAFATLALSEVSGQLSLQNERSLHNGAKTAGMGLAAKLSQVTGDLALAREITVSQVGGGELSPSSLPPQVRLRLARLWVLDGDHVIVLLGDGPEAVGELDAGDRERLASGGTLLRTVGPDPHLVLIAALRPGSTDRALLVARPSAEFLFDAGELRSPGADAVVLDEANRPLFHTVPHLPDLAPLTAVVARQPASGTFEWTVAEQRHVARFWRVFLRPQYGADLLVVQTRVQTEALEVVHGFQRWFLLTAFVTLLLVVGAGLVQIRRTLDPIVALRAGTQRVARGDLTARVRIKSRDEFGELGQAFDHMTEELGESLRRRAQSEEELTASRDEALAAARAKAEFVINVSHEFRTPMAEILGATEILNQLGDIDPEARKEFTLIAHSGAQRLARLIDEVFEIGSTAGWETRPEDVAGSLAEAVAAMPPAARDRLQLEVEPDLPPVVGAGRRLVELWCRLFDNAAKFSDAEEPIRVCARRIGDRIAVEVQDRGVGITLADQALIFEPFRQVGRDQMTDKAMGTGLGLTLARRTAERLGGAIEVESDLGKGSLFRVLLPQHVEAPVAVS